MGDRSGGVIIARVMVLKELYLELNTLADASTKVGEVNVLRMVEWDCVVIIEQVLMKRAMRQIRVKGRQEMIGLRYD